MSRYFDLQIIQPLAQVKMPWRPLAPFAISLGMK
jgi:hypothetical protein